MDIATVGMGQVLDLPNLNGTTKREIDNKKNSWNVGPLFTNADDITFTKDFIKEITAQACFGPKSIYTAGFSISVGISNYVGCSLLIKLPLLIRQLSI